MPFPAPHPGLAIHYAYRWHAEHLQEQEGVKDQPCVIVLATEDPGGEVMVTVVPVTHTPPLDPSTAVEIPLATKYRLGLDAERSWVVCSELNRFLWPGSALQPLPGQLRATACGVLPPRLFQQIKHRLISRAVLGRSNAFFRS